MRAQYHSCLHLAAKWVKTGWGDDLVVLGGYFSDKQLEYIGFQVFNRIGCLEPPYFKIGIFKSLKQSRF